MSAECSKHGTDLVYPEGTWPVGVCPSCEREQQRIDIGRKTKALHRIYAIAPIGSDVAEIARRAIAGLEEIGTPEDRRLSPTKETK